MISIIIITVDVTISRKGFETKSEGRCLLFGDTSATEGIQLSLTMCLCNYNYLANCTIIVVADWLHTVFLATK